MKIGGSVLNNLEGFKKLIDILKEDESNSVLLIISAFSKATRNLEDAALHAEKGSTEKSNQIIDSFIDQHYEYVKDLSFSEESLNQISSIFDKSAGELRDLIKGISITEELTRRTLDLVLSYGELFALHTVFNYLKENKLPIGYLDSTEVIISDSNYGFAKPDIEKTRLNVDSILRSKLEKNKIVVTQGFVARSTKGEITTMGIESSNLTAVLYAELMNEKQITFWTDVEGIYEIDPKLKSPSKLIEKMTYSYALEAANNGLKLIYPTMIVRASLQGINLVFKSAFNIKGGQTEISDFPELENKPIIVLKEGLTCLRINYSSKEEQLKISDSINKFQEKYNQVFSYYTYPNSVILLIGDKFLNKFKLVSSDGIKNMGNYSVISVLNKEVRKLIDDTKIFESIDESENPVIANFGIGEKRSVFAVPNANMKKLIIEIYDKCFC